MKKYAKVFHTCMYIYNYTHTYTMYYMFVPVCAWIFFVNVKVAFYTGGKGTYS